MDDQIEKPARTCGNCACFHVITDENNPNNKQGFCRLDPANMTKARVEVPRIRNGQPVMKDGRPVMEMGEQIAFFYKPTMSSLVCFSGWRPIGAEPGEVSTGGFSSTMIEAYKKLYTDMMTQSATSMPQPADFPDAMRCAHGRLEGTFCDDCLGGVATTLPFDSDSPTG